MYRRGEAPEAPATRAKGQVVRLADEPDQLDAAERQLRELRHRAQSERVREDFLRAQRRTAWMARALGAGLLVVSILLLSMSHRHGLRTSAVAGLGLFVGPFMLAFGFGGAVRPDATSPAWRLATIVLGVVGATLGMIGAFDGIFG